MQLHVNAAEFGVINTPTPCERRLFLYTRQIDKLEPGAFEMLLRHLGDLHERRQFDLLVERHGPVLDLSDTSNRVQRTLDAIREGVRLIYQPEFEAITEISGYSVLVKGRPDFLISTEEGYAITDAKLARSLDGNKYDHIRHQLAVYGWLFEQSCGELPFRLDVIRGDGELEHLPLMQDRNIQHLLEHLVNLKTTDIEPLSPVGWSKCLACGYKTRCWVQAVEDHDVATLTGVDQNLATVLTAESVTTYERLLARHNEETLADVIKPWGQKSRRVGSRDAADAIRNARALVTNTHIVFNSIDLPAGPDWVMFDLEGVPPQLDELDKIYLWGMQVYGESKGVFRAAVAGLEEDSDRHVWEQFLMIADEIMTQYPGISFVHWHSYERTYINKYIERFGDIRGIGQIVLDSLFDLLPATRASVAFPLPSYSLKVVEKYVGFKRELDMKGDVSIAAYVKALESGSPEGYEELMQDILKYNEEDLAATWAVFEWLQERKSDVRVSQ